MGQFIHSLQFIMADPGQAASQPWTENSRPNMQKEVGRALISLSPLKPPASLAPFLGLL